MSSNTLFRSSDTPLIFIFSMTRSSSTLSILTFNLWISISAFSDLVSAIFSLAIRSLIDFWSCSSRSRAFSSDTSRVCWFWPTTWRTIRFNYSLGSFTSSQVRLKRDRICVNYFEITKIFSKLNFYAEKTGILHFPISLKRSISFF